MLTPISIGITYNDPVFLNRASQLARALSIPLCCANNVDYLFLLIYTSEGLQLCCTDKKILQAGPICANFLSGKIHHRRKTSANTSELIARAVGIKPQYKPTILDLTAGLGQDAFVLAYLGCQVQMLERSPIIATLLQDGLDRLFADPILSDGLQLSLLNEDAKNYLLNSANDYSPDVIYLDPMYPEKKKNAGVKKEMQALRYIVGADADAHELLALALRRALKRVVIKRPRIAPPLSGLKPDIVFTGQSSRFDVHLLKK